MLNTPRATSMGVNRRVRKSTKPLRAMDDKSPRFRGIHATGMGREFGSGEILGAVIFRQTALYGDISSLGWGNEIFAKEMPPRYEIEIEIDTGCIGRLRRFSAVCHLILAPPCSCILSDDSRRSVMIDCC
jgi:hypothetical protein